MGLFGNKDVKLLDRELLALFMALKLGSGASSSAERFAQGVRSAEVDAVGQATCAIAAGKAAEVAALVTKMRGKPLAGDAKAHFDQVLDQVHAVLG